MNSPAVFSFPAKGWRFQVYVKDLTDPDGGGSITHRPGKFAHDYVLTLMVHADMSDTSKILGKSNGTLAVKKDQAIQSYINRIADGIGWTFSEYNGQGNPANTIAEATGSFGSGAHTTGDKPSER